MVLGGWGVPASPCVVLDRSRGITWDFSEMQTLLPHPDLLKWEAPSRAQRSVLTAFQVTLVQAEVCEPVVLQSVGLCHSVRAVIIEKLKLVWPPECQTRVQVSVLFLLH